MGVATPDLKALNKAASAAGMTISTWAKGAGMHRSRLSQAVHGHISLSHHEMKSCTDTVRDVLAQRVRLFNELLKSNFSTSA